MIRAIVAMVIWLTLPACGGGGGGSGGGAPGSGAAGTPGPGNRPPFVLPVVTPPDARIGRLAAYEAQKIRVLGGSGSGFAGLAPTTGDLPARGTISFAGFASLRVESAPVLTMFGDATLTADFASNTANGDMTGFFGTGPGGTVSDFTGSLTITGGQALPDLQLRYTGVLTGPGEQINVNGTLAGGFLGDPVGAVQALDLDTQVNRNGQPLPATMLIVAERTGLPP